MLILKKGNNNTKPLAYTALVRPILEYGAVCCDPYREGQVSALNRVQKRAAKFANNIYVYIYIYIPMPPHVLMNFRGFSPGCGNSVAGF